MKFIVCVFKYKWVDSNTGVWTNDVGFTLVDPKKLTYQKDLFIMAKQAKQVFYVQDPCDERWCMVLQGKTIGQLRKLGCYLQTKTLMLTLAV